MVNLEVVGFEDKIQDQKRHSEITTDAIRYDTNEYVEELIDKVETQLYEEKIDITETQNAENNNLKAEQVSADCQTENDGQIISKVNQSNKDIQTLDIKLETEDKPIQIEIHREMSMDRLIEVKPKLINQNSQTDLLQNPMTIVVDQLDAPADEAKTENKSNLVDNSNSFESAQVEAVQDKYEAKIKDLEESFVSTFVIILTIIAQKAQ